jgi:hypothetical protein
MRVSGCNVALKTAKRALLVIAHPDDESMFFAPTLHRLHSQGAAVLILCLSNGERLCLLHQHGTMIITQCTPVTTAAAAAVADAALLCLLSMQETGMALVRCVKRSFWQRAGCCR